MPQSTIAVVPSQRTVRKIARRRKINRLFQNIQLCLEVLQFVSLQMLINVNLLFQDHKNSLLESLFQEDILWNIYNGEFLTALIDFDKDLVFNRFLREKLYSMKNQPYIFLGGKIPNSKYVSFIKFKIVIKAAKGTPPRKKIDFFRALPEKGGGEGLARIFLPFFHHVVPFILTSISCYVILFGHF